jgi:hypothetical protein
MPRSPIVLALLMCVALPASARAQGLYEPFPEPAPAAHARGYLDRLGVTATAAELQRGRFVAARGGATAIVPAAVQDASGRAGGGSAEGVALVAFLCGALLAGGLLTLHTRL